jgi:GT2 family glycosyltransferase
MSKISVVIPARDSQETIRITVESILTQTLLPHEILIVVGQGDKTEGAIADYIKSGKVKIIRAEAPKDYIRDAQWKRWKGVNASVGDMIFLTDSKVVLEKHALENSLRLMNEYGVMVVGGITPAWPDQKKNFWARLTDGALISNLPVFSECGFITKQNFGKTESLPVTTALMFTRSVFAAVKGDFALEFSKLAATYDDYVLSWLIAKAGYTILVTNTVVAHHLHRTDWKSYSKQISRSGQSAAVMARMYPECPFGKRRIRQVWLTIAASGFASICFLAMTVYGFGGIVFGAFLTATVYLILATLNSIKAKDWQAAAFPFFTLLLILTFAMHFSKTYLCKEMHPSVVNKYLQVH